MDENTASPAERRKPISRRLRFEILRRDNYTCRYCGGTAPDVVLTVDHVIPVALGGGDDPNNLATACKDCNAGKASVAPDSRTVEDVDASALLFSAAMERVAEIRRAAILKDERLVSWFDQLWTSYHYGYNARELPRSPHWSRTVVNYVAAGLEEDTIEAYVRRVMDSDTPPENCWRYFCWWCRTELTERQEMARRLIEDGMV